MNLKDYLKIVISSDVDYEKLIAEIYRNDEFIAILQQEDGINNLKVEFSTNISALNLSWLQHALNEAKIKLLKE